MFLVILVIPVFPVRLALKVLRDRKALLVIWVVQAHKVLQALKAV